MSGWDDAKEKLKQMLGQLGQQSKSKDTSQRVAPTTKSGDSDSDGKTAVAASDEEIFLTEMEQEGVKPIPEFIAIQPEHGAVKQVVLKYGDLAAKPMMPGRVTRFVVAPPPKKKLPSMVSTRKSISSVLPNEIPRGRNRVTIGIDFGTSTTKVCARHALGGNDVPVYRIDISNSPKAWDAFTPSLVSIHESSLFFGDHAQQGVIIPHVKVCLACSEGHFGSRECIWAEACPIARAGLSAEDLATLYLAWVMNESRNRLPVQLKNMDGFVFNVGVPLKQLDDSPLRAIFEQIAYSAWRLCDGVTQGLTVEQAKKWLEVVKQQYTNVSPARDRMVQLCPETSAAIVTFVNSTNALPGLYCLSDIGAWTSDISVFRLTDVEKHETGVDRLSFYAAGVTRKACEEIDIRIVHSLAEMWGLDTIDEFLDDNILREIRSVREHRKPSATFSVSTSDGMQRERTVPVIAIDYARHVVAEAVSRYFVSVLKEAYREKERIPDNWRNVSLVVTGGGSQDSIFEEVLSKNSGCGFHRLPLISDIIRDVTKEQHFRFAVAAGLSHPTESWPEQLRPSEVGAWKPREAKHIKDRDEQYAK